MARGGGSLLGLAFLRQAMLSARGEYPMGHTLAVTAGEEVKQPAPSVETTRDQPRREALVSEVILLQMGYISAFAPPKVLSAPSFAYNHQEALLVRNKAARAPI